MAELRKVVWPTRQQLITYFWVVLVFVVVVMTCVSLLDLGFGKLAFEIFALTCRSASSSSGPRARQRVE